MSNIEPVTPQEIVQRRIDAKNPHTYMIPKILIEINSTLKTMDTLASEVFSFTALGYPVDLVESIAQRLANAGWEVRLFPESSTDFGFEVFFPQELRRRIV